MIEDAPQTSVEMPDPGDRLRQMQKLQALGRITGEIAHDFNKLLTVILGNLEAAELHSGADANATARRRKAIVNARRGAERAATLSQKLLGFSRHRDLDPKPLALENVVAEEIEFIRRVLGEIVEVELMRGPTDWLVCVDQSEFQAALLNLAVNARDAMPDGGKVAIAVRGVVVVEDVPEGRAPGAYVTLSVADNGVGMAPDVLHRVFEPFFTTKSSGHGTGLGLSQVHGFITRADGHVAVESEPGKGTCVTLYLPRYVG